MMKKVVVVVVVIFVMMRRRRRTTTTTMIAEYSYLEKGYLVLMEMKEKGHHEGRRE